MAKRGRKPLDPEFDSTVVSAKVTTDLYDRTYASATRRGLAVSDVVREALNRWLRATSTSTK